MRVESVNLLVAALDLKLVRLLRAAMNAADGRGACRPGQLIHPEPRFEPRRRIHPEPKFEPRPHIHPEPRFEPRPVHRRCEAPPPPCCPPATPADAAATKSSTSPIQPPWKVLPWEEHFTPLSAPPVRTVKVFAGGPDVCRKGNLIDLFI